MWTWADPFVHSGMLCRRPISGERDYNERDSSMAPPALPRPRSHCADRPAGWNGEDDEVTYEGTTTLQMDHILTLLKSEYQHCQRILYDELMLPRKTSATCMLQRYATNPTFRQCIGASETIQVMQICYVVLIDFCLMSSSGPSI